MGEETKAVAAVAESNGAGEAKVATNTADPSTNENKPAEVTRSEQILKAKELYSHGSRNFLVKSYADAAVELSEVCRIYDDLYGNLSDELGMPYLLYAKSLIALALDENKVIDVPDEEEDDEDDEEEDDDEVAEGEANGEASTSTSEAKTNGNGKDNKPLESIAEEEKKPEEADSTENSATEEKASSKQAPTSDAEKEASSSASNGSEEAAVSSSDAAAEKVKASEKNGESSSANDDEKPSTSKGETENGGETTGEAEEEEEDTSNLQLAWEVLELADKIFSGQGESGLANLAEVKTELANISFENNALETARSDYEKALKIYDDLPNNYRRARAEIHYKIGLTHLMQQANKDGADSLKKACNLIAEEVEELKQKEDLSEKEKNIIQDLEETQQEIWVKIAEIEETEAQTIAEVRAALDSYIKPCEDSSASTSEAGSSSAAVSSSSSSAAASAKPTDISHLIKRKKLEESNDACDEVSAASPAKRPALAEN